MSWYVCETHWRSEWKVSERIEAQGWRAVVPSYENGGKVRPLFLTYLFVNFELSERWKRILSVPGVRRLLGNEKPMPLRDDVAAAFLERRVEEEEPVILVKEGTVVRITTGPLLGLTGKVVRSNRERVRLLMDMLGRSPIDVSPNWIEPIAAA